MPVVDDELAPPMRETAEQAELATHLRRQLKACVQDTDGPLGSAADLALSGAGKLLRPLLMLDACLAVGGDPECVLPAALGTELGHVASLVHDDIIDRDTERRGQASVHARYGVPLAILTGDYLVFETFLWYSRCVERGVTAERTLAAIHTLSCTCLDLCRGQALEAALAGDANVSKATYLEVIRLKTASVWRAAAEIGASLGGGSAPAIVSLGAYGEELGLAFQILDDVLCYDAQPGQLGKPLDSDLRNGRVTLPVVYALAASPALRQDVLALLHSGPNARAAAHGRLVRLLVSSGALTRARATAAAYTRSAQVRLETLSASPARARLISRADQLLERTH